MVLYASRSLLNLRSAGPQTKGIQSISEKLVQSGTSSKLACEYVNRQVLPLSLHGVSKYSSLLLAFLLFIFVVIRLTFLKLFKIFI